MLCLAIWLIWHLISFFFFSLIIFHLFSCTVCLVFKVKEGLLFGTICAGLLDYKHRSARSVIFTHNMKIL